MDHLTQQLAAKDQEIERLKNDLYDAKSKAIEDRMKLRTDLASCRAREAKLRERCKEWLKRSVGLNVDYPYLHNFLQEEALAMPTDDSALFEFGMRVAEEVRFSERHHEAIVRECMGK